MSRPVSLALALAWLAVIWTARAHLPDPLWLFLLLLALLWIARAGVRALEGFVGPSPQRAGSVTVYVSDWGDRPEEAVEAARRLGCSLHPRILERSEPMAVAVAIGVSEETARALADGLRVRGADVSIRGRG